MTGKRELIDQIIQKTGINPYKLKRLSKGELEQLLGEYKKGDETIGDLLEALKPENYLTGRELGDRRMYSQIMGYCDWLWKKITGQPEVPKNFVGMMFVGLCYVLLFALVWSIIILLIIPGVEWLFGFDMSKYD